MAKRKWWCVASIDPNGARRWCAMARRVRGKAPAYRDSEQTKCCRMWITGPGGYEFRVPTCDGKEADDGE